jgi:hypothetical protein
MDGAIWFMDRFSGLRATKQLMRQFRWLSKRGYLTLVHNLLQGIENVINYFIMG